MQFETIAIIVFAIAVLFFLFIRRRVIQTLEMENAALGAQLHKLNQVAMTQGKEIDDLMAAIQSERRARQMAELTNKPVAPPITKPKWKDPDLARDPFKNDRMARKQEEATRADPGAGNSWDTAPSAFAPYSPSSAPSPAQAAAYQGAGGAFDGGGASGDYGRSDSSSCSTSSSSDSASSSSDSSSSCSSDSGSSSSSSD